VWLGRRLTSYKKRMMKKLIQHNCEVFKRIWVGEEGEGVVQGDEEDECV